MSEISRLRWRCRRGMRELDDVLLNYLERIYPEATAEHQQAFCQLLDCQDPEVLAYLTARSRPPGKDLEEIIESIE